MNISRVVVLLLAVAAVATVRTEIAGAQCETALLPATLCGPDGVWGLLVIIINVLSVGVGVLAIGGLAYGAFLYTSAGDSAEQVKKAMEIIKNVVIGIIAYIGMYAFLQFIIPGGVF